jgi:hypothetical protein
VSSELAKCLPHSDPMALPFRMRLGTRNLVYFAARGISRWLYLRLANLAKLFRSFNREVNEKCRGGSCQCGRSSHYARSDSSMRTGPLHRIGSSLQLSDDWPGERTIISPMPTEPIGSNAAWWIWNLSIWVSGVSVRDRAPLAEAKRRKIRKVSAGLRTRLRSTGAL